MSSLDWSESEMVRDILWIFSLSSTFTTRYTIFGPLRVHIQFLPGFLQHFSGYCKRDIFYIEAQSEFPHEWTVIIIRKLRSFSGRIDAGSSYYDVEEKLSKSSGLLL